MMNDTDCGGYDNSGSRERDDIGGYAGGDESKMLRRRLADTSTKIGVGANRAAVGSSMLQKYGHVDPCDAFCREKLACNRVASGKSAKIGVAILDDGMQAAPEPASRCGDCDGQWVDTLGKYPFHSTRTHEGTVERTYSS
uniref:tetraacyldisaccharide 4'-kinase n=1 Tax=Aegilops tauschii TaxID=37682 RepID=M8BWF5_AEGTA